MYTFSQSSGIDDTMLRLLSGLQRIRGVLDHGQGVHAWAVTHPLKAAGRSCLPTSPAAAYARSTTSSCSSTVGWSSWKLQLHRTANTLHDESIIVLGDLEETERTSARAEAAQQQLAAYALAEIDRIITDLAVPV
jgi:hypothetical protein